jgi:hypothetical protein
MSNRKLRTRHAVVVGTLALGLAAAGASAGFAATSRSPQQGGSVGTHAAKLATAVTPTVCNGGVLKRTYSIGSNDFQIVNAGPTQPLTTSSLTFAGPASGTDTVMVTFSAETQLRGNTDGAQFDWIEGQVNLDGVPITDVGPSQLALSGSSTYSSNAFQACVKVGPGIHRLTPRAGVVTNGSSTGETGWIDDWVLRADVTE